MNEFESIADFRNQFEPNPLRSSTAEYFRWKVERNPACRGLVYLAHRDNRTVGSCTLMPKRVRLREREAVAGELGDAYTDPAYRRQGIFVETVGSCTEYGLRHGMEIVFAIPNDRSQAGCQTKLGYGLCEQVRFRFLAKPLVSAGLLGRHLLKMLSFRKPGRQWRRCREIVKQLNTPRVRIAGIDIRPVQRFEESIDGLWGPPRYEFCIVRDAKYLNWRFFDNPDPYRVLGAFEEKRCLGYAAMKIIPDGRKAVLCDYITEQDRMDLFKALAEAAGRRAAAAGCRSIQTHCVQNNPYYAALEDMGFVDVGDGSERGIIVQNGTAAGRRLIESRQPWHFTLADTDNI